MGDIIIIIIIIITDFSIIEVMGCQLNKKQKSIKTMTIAKIHIAMNRWNFNR